LRIALPISRQVDHRLATQALKDIEVFALGVRPSANHRNSTQRAALRRRRLIAAERHDDFATLDALSSVLMVNHESLLGLGALDLSQINAGAGSVVPANCHVIPPVSADFLLGGRPAGAYNFGGKRQPNLRKHINGYHAPHARR
jgi:hypothetical protein